MVSTSHTIVRAAMLYDPVGPLAYRNACVKKQSNVFRHVADLKAAQGRIITHPIKAPVVHATRQVCCPAEKTAGKKLHGIQNIWLHLCKLETCTYISLAVIYGLTAITKILVAG